jgi:competence protein ComEC
MEAMLLGDKKDIPRTVYSDMIKSGTVHILVVSGFNVSIVAGLLALFLKILRLNRIIRLVIIVPALALYCLMTGASPPVVRATIMGVFFFSSWYVRRDPDIFQALSLSAFVMLVADPRELFDASFQLSFMSVFAICFLAPGIERLANLDRITLRPLRWVAGLMAVSLSAWIGTAGFIAYYFKIIAPVTVLANIFIPVIASFITLCGISLVAAGYLCPYLAITLASVSESLIVFLLWFNSFFIHIPGAYTRLP